MYLTIQGIVLRVTDYNDKDALLTMLTRRHGRLTVKARGLRRKNSPLIAPCQLLSYGEFTLFEYRGQYTINEAQSIELFTPLRRDLTKLSLGTYFAQVSEVLSQEDMPNPELLSMTLNSIYALCHLGKPQQQVKAVFELRAMCLAGYEPMADACALCGAPEPENPMLDVVHGVVHCGKCREKGGLSLPLTAAGLAALRYILYGDAKRLYSFALPQPGLRALDHASDAYVTAQLERSFRTLDYYKSILPQEETKYE